MKSSARYQEGRRLARAGLCQLADVQLLKLADKPGFPTAKLECLAAAVARCYKVRAARGRRAT